MNTINSTNGKVALLIDGVVVTVSEKCFWSIVYPYANKYKVV